MSIIMFFSLFQSILLFSSIFFLFKTLDIVNLQHAALKQEIILLQSEQKIILGKLENIQQLISAQSLNSFNQSSYLEYTLLIGVVVIVFLILFKPDDNAGSAADFLTQNVIQLSNENSMILDQLSDVHKLLLAKTSINPISSVIASPGQVAQLDTLFSELLH